MVIRGSTGPSDSDVEVWGEGPWYQGGDATPITTWCILPVWAPDSWDSGGDIPIVGRSKHFHPSYKSSLLGSPWCYEWRMLADCKDHGNDYSFCGYDGGLHPLFDDDPLYEWREDVDGRVVPRGVLDSLGQLDASMYIWATRVLHQWGWFIIFWFGAHLILFWAHSFIVATRGGAGDWACTA